MAKWRKARSPSPSYSSSSSQTAFSAQKAHITQLISSDRPEAALHLLELLEEEHADDAELQMQFGICYLGMGEPLMAMTRFETAYKLEPRPTIWYPLGTAYLQNNMLGSALYAFNESEQRGAALPEDVAPIVQSLRNTLEEAARELGMSFGKYIAGLRDYELANRLLALNDTANAIVAYREAVRQFGTWPQARTSLAMALSLDGQMSAAISEARQVLAQHPQNLEAACYLVRFLAWSGDRPAAEALWGDLQNRTPDDLPGDATLLAQAAGIMDDDESVDRLLAPLADWDEDQFSISLQYQQVQLYLAIAEANLGDPDAALERLQYVDLEEDIHAQLVAEALEDGFQSLGLVDRFAYHLAGELIPSFLLSEMMDLVPTVSSGNDPQAEKEMKRHVARYPQLVVMAEKLVLEEDQVPLGLLMLRSIGTPAAHAALRRFALGQLGSDEERMAALYNLQAGGGVQPGERFMMWINDAWEEIQPPNFAIRAHYDHPPYRPQVSKLMAEAMSFLSLGNGDEAIPLLRQVIALEPKALEAYSNLASVLNSAGDKAGSRELLEQALAINPNYLYARVNLALGIMDEDIQAATDYLAPLATVTNFTADEFTFYQYALGRLAMRDGDVDKARRHLEMALAINPEHPGAVELMATINPVDMVNNRDEVQRTLQEIIENFSKSLGRSDD